MTPEEVQAMTPVQHLEAMLSLAGQVYRTEDALMTARPTPTDDVSLTQFKVQTILVHSALAQAKLGLDLMFPVRYVTGTGTGSTEPTKETP